MPHNTPAIWNVITLVKQLLHSFFSSRLNDKQTGISLVHIQGQFTTADLSCSGIKTTDSTALKLTKHLK